MDDIKPSLFATAVGFFLSLLVGLLSGVSFFVLFLRAIVLGLVCGALTFGAAKVLRKFVPEIFSQDTSSIAQPVNPVVGTKVNIVLDDNEESTEETFQSDELQDVATKLETQISNTPILGQSFGSDPTETSAFASVSATSGGDGATLEALPDLKGFEDISDVGTGETTTSDLVDAGTEEVRKDDNTQIDAANVGNMARAIQTILKKETT